MAGMQMAEVQRIMGDAPQTLTINKQSTEKAVQAADALLENARSVGMSDALDGEMARYVDKAKKTIVTMNDRRKPFTQIMDAVKKELTTLEADLKTKIAEVQAQRDGYATMKMEEQRRREREAQEKLAREREAIDLAKSADIGLAENFAEHFREAKSVMLEKFNGASLSTFDETMGEVQSFSEELTKGVYAGFAPRPQHRYHSDEEAAAIVKVALRTHFDADVASYRLGIAAYKRELLDKRNSKLAELKEMEAAGTAERERLEAERKQREDAERDRLNREAEDARAKAAAESETQAAGAAAQAEIATMAEVGTSEAQVRESYSIKVKNPTGNMLIASMWFQNEGKGMTQDKIDRVTFERMRKFCEKHAMATGEFIDSPFVVYTEVFRAK